MSEQAKMLAGELYDAMDPGLVTARRRARDIVARYNAGPVPALLRELLGEAGNPCRSLRELEAVS